MRLLELRLLAYGPFTEVELDLDCGAPALHVLHGRNEAGKSTTLRALTGLLFGIEERTRDDKAPPWTTTRTLVSLAAWCQQFSARLKPKLRTNAAALARATGGRTRARTSSGRSGSRF